MAVHEFRQNILYHFATSRCWLVFAAPPRLDGTVLFHTFVSFHHLECGRRRPSAGAPASVAMQHSMGCKQLLHGNGLVIVLVALLAASEGATSPDDMQPDLNLRSAPACYTLLNTRGPVGCRSPTPGGMTAPVVIVDTQEDFDAFTRAVIGSKQQRAVLLPAALLTSDNLLALQSSGRCAGVLLADSVTPPPHGFSPADPMPYCKCGAVPPCDQRWNPAGNGLEQRSFDFPLISLSEAEAKTLRQRVSRGSQDPAVFPQYQVQMNTYMDAFQGYTFQHGQWWELQASQLLFYYWPAAFLLLAS